MFLATGIAVGIATVMGMPVRAEIDIAESLIVVIRTAETKTDIVMLLWQM